MDESKKASDADIIAIKALSELGKAARPLNQALYKWILSKGIDPSKIILESYENK